MRQQQPNGNGKEFNRWARPAETVDAIGAQQPATSDASVMRLPAGRDHTI
jgi:hypothetical protein